MFLFLLLLGYTQAFLTGQDHLKNEETYLVPEYKEKCNQAWPLFFKHAYCVTNGDGGCLERKRRFIYDKDTGASMTAARLDGVKATLEGNSVKITGSCGDVSVLLTCTSSDDVEQGFVELCERSSTFAPEDFQVFVLGAEQAVVWLQPTMAPNKNDKTLNFRVLSTGKDAKLATQARSAYLGF
ncbi:MAG: uncharacterized protein KVP18_002274 [Porospora cf. gigantea A]|uniref:uncharacterized protein n=1 Tax=Porospora cf. gigantea A TaxID=2853593 RepID=UPI003559EF68|nr:MAG: hypothetical protein KVP18_002274 [Porospora cf. gigantea A]